MCFSPYLGVGGGGDTKGSRAHHLLMQFSGLGSSKMEISETDFFHTLTIQNDQISYVKHVLAPPYVFLTVFGCWGGGVPRGLGHNLLMKFSRLSHLSPLRGALPKAIEFLVPCWGCFSFLCIWDVATLNCHPLLPVFNRFYPFSPILNSPHYGGAEKVGVM